MEINLIKNNLRNIAWISDCFKGKITESDVEEIKRIEKLKKTGLGIDTYARRFLNDVIQNFCRFNVINVGQYPKT